MKRFVCPNCGHELHFESQGCVVCGQVVGMNTRDMRLKPLSLDTVVDGVTPCLNAETVGCNWLAEKGSTFCIACRHNRVVPDLSIEGSRESWMSLELAKRKLIYTLEKWGLPHPTRDEDHDRGLAFDFLADTRNPDGSMNFVQTGHLDGIITLNIAEGDEAERVERKKDLSEPYRTVIGHLRHEIAHFYWMHLIDGTRYLDDFRGLFGDETQDYAAALQTHYANGPADGWQDSFISAYATSHPWEDFAETWAHWMHIVDGLETAQAYGMDLREAGSGRPATDAYIASDVGALVNQWVPLTVAINSMNRGMGQPDLYPFVLSTPVVAKMEFINRLIQDSASR